MKGTIKKLLSLALCGAMLTAVLGGCTNQETETTPSVSPSASEEASQAPTGGVTDGTYTGTAEGFGGEVSVTITVSGGVITAVDAVGDSETESVGQAALPDLAQAILDAQSPNIDGVSGATVTSEAVMAAAKDAMTQAGMTVEEEETPHR